MSWITPITDRTLADVIGRHLSKAFLDADTWERIIINTEEVQAQILSDLGLTVTLDALAVPVITDFPTAAKVNTLVGNINHVIAGACIPGTSPLFAAWKAGNTVPAPKYTDVNAWEQALLTLHTLIPTAADYTVSCGVAATGQERYWQNRFR